MTKSANHVTCGSYHQKSISHPLRVLPLRTFTDTRHFRISRFIQIQNKFTYTQTEHALRSPWLITAADCIRPVPGGEIFTLSIRRQEYLMKAIFYGLRYRLHSNQARICVLGSIANRVWLVSRFYVLYIFYITTKRDRSQYQLCSPMSDAVISQAPLHCKNCEPST